MSQEEAASRAGIDYKRFQRVEAGLVNVTVKTLVRLASALGTTFWQLVERGSDPEQRRRTKRTR